MGDRLLREVLAGQDPVAVMTAEQLRGTLPPGVLGRRALAGVTEECQKLFTRTADLRAGEPRSIDVDVDLGDGRRLTGTVARVHGTKVVSLGYSRLKPRQRLLAVARPARAQPPRFPDESWTSPRRRPGAGRSAAGPGRSARPSRASMAARPGRAARRGLDRPLPLPLATAAAWAEAPARELQGEDRDPIGVARRAWATDPHNDYGILGEDADAYHQRIYGDSAPVERAPRRRAAGVRLADLGAAAHRRRAGGPTVMARRWTPFDVCGPLPTGTTLLEASAGTGKTWTIGALVTRYVAEGEARLEQMLVVTFGRAASQELRERVRAQLVEAERALGDDPTPRRRGARLRPDPAAARLRRRRAPVRHRRVLEALAGFDAATIATTHQFCSMVLGSLGVAGDTDSRARLVEDLDDLIERGGRRPLPPRVRLRRGRPGLRPRSEAMAIARDAIGDPQAHLEPAGEDRSTPAGRRVAFADAVRTEMDRRKRRLGILSYDDLLSQLAEALVDDDAPGAGADAAALADRAGRRVPGHRPGAVAGARPRVHRPRHDGADRRPEAGDLRVPGRRRHDVPRRRRRARPPEQTLAVNWRSDAALLAAFQELLAGAELGDEQIVVHPTSRPTTARPAGRCAQGGPAAGPRRAPRAVRRGAATLL